MLSDPLLKLFVCWYLVVADVLVDTAERSDVVAVAADIVCEADDPAASTVALVDVHQAEMLSSMDLLVLSSDTMFY